MVDRLYRSLGLAAHLGWARLLVDRYRDLIQQPLPARQKTASARSLAHLDEDAFEHDNFVNPETPSPPKTRARSSTATARTQRPHTTPTSLLPGQLTDLAV